MHVAIHTMRGEQGRVLLVPEAGPLGFAFPDERVVQFLLDLDVRDPDTGKELSFGDGRRYLGALVLRLRHSTYVWTELVED